MVGVRGIELQVVVEALALACLGPARLLWLRCGNAFASCLPLPSPFCSRILQRRCALKQNDYGWRGREKWLGWVLCKKESEQSPQLEPCQATSRRGLRGGCPSMRAQNQPGLPSCRWATPQNLGLVVATENLGHVEATEGRSTFKDTSGIFQARDRRASIRGLKNW